jgi:hypothetical protein
VGTFTGGCLSGGLPDIAGWISTSLLTSGPTVQGVVTGIESRGLLAMQGDVNAACQGGDQQSFADLVGSFVTMIEFLRINFPSL